MFVKKTEPWRKLWGTLFKARPKDEHLFQTGIEWLEQTNPKTPQWRETLQVLITRRPLDEKLFVLGLNWLLTPNQHSDGWNHLWQAMIKARPTDSQLITLAHERLKESNLWGGLDLVGDDTFWATNASTDNVWRFNLTSGSPMDHFNTGTSGGHAAGVGVRGAPAQSPPP